MKSWSSWPRGRSVEERFAERVDRSAGADACWPWLGGANGKGYGTMTVDGKSTRANRLALELDGRPLDSDQLACHTCDNPSCVNPKHLYVGDGTTNQRDRFARNPASTRSFLEAAAASRASFATFGRPKRAPRSHCRRGHELADGNVTLKADGKRICRTCNLANRAVYRAKAREQRSVLSR